MLPAKHLELIERAERRRARLAAQASRPWTAEAFWPALVAIPAAAALLSAAVQPKRRGSRAKSQRERNTALAAVATVAGMSLVRWQLARLFAAQPRYSIERQIGELEIRHYEDFVQAVTTVEATSWRDGLDHGFRRLARYIFGGNTPRVKIGMTTPVLTHGTPSDASHAAVTVAFVMPSARDVGGLPAPTDRRVRLRKLTAQRVATLRFSGALDSERIRAKQNELLALVERAGFRTRGQPLFAGYDPPSTLPLLRRMEVWVELA